MANELKTKTLVKDHCGGLHLVLEEKNKYTYLKELKKGANWMYFNGKDRLWRLSTKLLHESPSVLEVFTVNNFRLIELLYG